ncbi:hypothetical protein EJ03DRAFT_77028 [Teratosphaeria nubilosa]|uniref:Uncharacterized protein n=1 Tax=Teratosphaeria nubilosa TaxID=161662 RepID=A0A6G1LBG9_9PEZI|nr:hypothetical protein EJ03DRAFT_77028 [Teratosphaeria nubilosa]
MEVLNPRACQGAIEVGNHDRKGVDGVPKVKGLVADLLSCHQPFRWSQALVYCDVIVFSHGVFPYGISQLCSQPEQRRIRAVRVRRGLHCREKYAQVMLLCPAKAHPLQIFSRPALVALLRRVGSGGTTMPLLDDYRLCCFACTISPQFCWIPMEICTKSWRKCHLKRVWCV